jgi:NADH-quinone oxidoreductase subunit E
MIVPGKKVDSIIQRYKGEKSALIPILQDIQTEYNWLSPETLKFVATRLNVPLINVYGIASFFKAFSLKPRGKHLITVCLGTACHVRGGQKVVETISNNLKINPGETTKDMQFSLETVNCLGCCALGPVVVVDGKYHGHMNVAKVPALISQYSSDAKTKNVKKSRRT